MNLRSDAPEGRASARCLFSAKVAAFISSLGQRPRDSCNAKPPALKARFMSSSPRRGFQPNAKPPALKARFIPAAICVGLTVNRCVESRQNLAAASWHESALLALNWYSARPRRCGRETPVVNDRLIK